jgi:hypothetical protein
MEIGRASASPSHDDDLMKPSRAASVATMKALLRPAVLHRWPRRVHQRVHRSLRRTNDMPPLAGATPSTANRDRCHCRRAVKKHGAVHCVPRRAADETDQSQCVAQRVDAHQSKRTDRRRASATGHGWDAAGIQLGGARGGVVPPARSSPTMVARSGRPRVGARHTDRAGDAGGLARLVSRGNAVAAPARAKPAPSAIRRHRSRWGCPVR